LAGRHRPVDRGCGVRCALRRAARGIGRMGGFVGAAGAQASPHGRMEPSLLSGTANPRLADAVAAELGVEPAACAVERFPDGEVSVEIQASVRDRDVVIVQPTSPPPDPHLLELLAMADAARRAGGRRITAVVPYFAYARSDSGPAAACRPPPGWSRAWVGPPAWAERARGT